MSLSDLSARRELLVDPLPDYAHARVFDPKDLREPAQGRPQTVLVLEGKASGLAALPAGVVRVFARDTTGMTQFIGEDMLAQKAKGEPMRVILGPDNDVSVDRLQTTFHGARPPDDSYESVWQVRLSNHKPTEVVVRVHDQLPLNGEVSEETQPHETINPRHVVWPVTVAAGGEAVLTYKVRKSP